MKAKPMIKMIEELNKELTEWTLEETRKAIFKKADKYFDDNIRNIDHGKEEGRWYRSVKEFSKYKKSSSILNL